MRLVGCTLLAGALWLASACRTAAPPPAVLASAHDLDALAADYWEESLERDPIGATINGDRRFDARVPDISSQALAAHRERRRAFGQRLTALDLSGATDEQKLTARVLGVLIESELAVDVCQRDLWDVDQLGGYQSAVMHLAGYQTVDSKAALDAYVARLEGLGALFAEHERNLETGIARGFRAPRLAVERVVAQLERLVAGKPEESALLEPLSRLPAAEQGPARERVVATLRAGLVPAWSRYRSFLAGRYLQTGVRVEPSVATNPAGAECYAALVRHYTGSTSAPSAIHELGVAELKRLHSEMDAIARSLGHPDRLALQRVLRESPRVRFESRAALIEHNERIVARALEALPRAFGRLPTIPIGVKAIEEYREADQPAAYYYQAPDDASRSAFYYLNTHAHETRPFYNMEALAFHEAVPGHHLQIALAQQLTDLPEVRRHGSFGAFVEGWGLYAELLADELGLYSSPETRFGMLNFQAWRAARLVVDTGMHALGWSRERALAYMMDNLSFPEAEMANEIDRYIVWPGQALSYMLGRMSIVAARERAKSTMGARFELRAFHDEVLGHGALPLAVLDAVVDAWAARSP